MKEINNIEQLRSEKARLKTQLTDIEGSICGEFNYFTNHVQPIFNIVDFSKEKLSNPMVSGIVKLALPLIMGRVAKTVVKKGAKSSVLGIAATLATEYFTKSVDIAEIGQKVIGLFSRHKSEKP